MATQEERRAQTRQALLDAGATLFADLGVAAALIEAEQATATSLDEWVAAMWHAVSDPPSGDGRWIALEHELWSYAAQSDDATRYLAKRYQAA